QSSNLAQARAALLARLGLARAPARFDEALTHPSYANEHRRERVPDNQRLEFLGDGVLDLCVSEALLEALPEANEGVLSRAYAALVDTETLASWGREVALGEALQVGKGALHSGIRDQSSVLADAVEALIAAVYVDSGLDAARQLARLIIKDKVA